MVLSILNYVLIFVVFSGSFVFMNFIAIDAKISYVIMILCFFPLVFLCRGVIFSRKALILFLIILILSIANIFKGNNSWFLLMKAWLGITFSSLVFYLLIRANKYDLRKLFKIYLNLAFLVGLIGFFQELFYIVGLRWGYDFSYFLPFWKVSLSQVGLLRVNSIMPEPAAFCYCMMPAFYMATSSLLGVGDKLVTKPKSLIIVCSVFLSLSLVGYIGMVFCILSIFLNYQRKRRLIICLILIGAFLVGSYHGIVDIRMRVDDSIGILKGTTTAKEANLSTFTYWTNLVISYYGFIDHPLFGSGLGSRELTYHTYFDKVVGSTHHRLMNIKDANSLFLRVTTELGLFGLTLVIIFISRFYVKRKEGASSYLWLISNSVLALFVIRFLRSGHYFNNGMFFFVWLYYFAGEKAVLESKTILQKRKRSGYAKRRKCSTKDSYFRG